MTDIASRLDELGVVLPGPLPTAGAYRPVLVSGNLAYTSGMLGVADGALAYPGCVGVELDLDAGKASARAACISVLGALHHELGSLDRVERVLNLTGFIRAAADFLPLPSVLDGASELLLDVFGEAGQHARAAIGVAALPFGGSVEVQLVVQVRAGR